MHRGFVGASAIGGWRWQRTRVVAGLVLGALLLGTTVFVGSAARVRAATAGPAVYAINPNSGPTQGGTGVTIFGSGFTGATQVKFGSASTNCNGSRGFFVISDTEIFIDTPSNPAGTVDVVVVGPAGSSAVTPADRFTYSTPTAPVVYGLTPNAGSTAGGTSVQIFGTGFLTATSVLFGTLPVGVFAFSDKVLNVTAPAEPAGTVDVTVVNSAGSSVTGNNDKFTFGAASGPNVQAVSPNHGSAAGGEPVVIDGTGFSRASVVHFGSAAVGGGSFSLSGDTFIFLNAPAGTAGTTVDVTVTTPSGTSSTTNADKYSYVAAAAPRIDGLTGNQGSTAGGEFVDIFGSGFTGETSVKFGAQSATTVFTGTDNELVAKSPPGSVGTVDITVTTPVGTSATTAADKFTYQALSAPVIYGISPHHGVTTGRTTVDIFGASLVTGSTVHFGANLGTSVNALDNELIVDSPPGSAGTVDITVTNAAGTSAPSTTDKFTYTAPGTPVVNAVIPNRGAASGGTSVTLFGSGFSGATAVKFGTAAATGVFVFNDTQMSLSSPAGTTGTTVDITVTTAVGTSSPGAADQFTYFTPAAPTITAVSPGGGPATGGTRVWITGTALTGVFAVNFGANPASGWFPVSDTLVEVFNSPQGTSGTTVDVTVSTPGGTSATNASDKFAYSAPPTPAISSVSPSSGPASGGTTVYITGSGLAGATAVNFGATPAARFFPSSSDGSVINATAPAGTASTTVDVTVVGPGGTSAITANDHFSYGAAVTPPAPAVTAVSPGSGPASGGTTVYVTGTHFTGATQVMFGTTAAFSFFVQDDDLIQVTSVGGTAGTTVDVTVTTAGGTSATSGADHFAYAAAVLPAVTNISPATGPAVGGTTVYISGTNLGATVSVSFGGTAATSLTTFGPNLVGALSPAQGGSPATVDITVTTSAGTSATTPADQFTYGGPPPSGLQVNGVTPNTGPTTGGTQVTIGGLGFTGATSVKFGSAAALSFFVFSDNQISAVSPAGAAGRVDITVTAGGSTSAVNLVDGFTYAAPGQPAVNAVFPNRGSQFGGTSVTIFGSGLSGATSVKFGTTAPAFFNVVGDSEIFTTSPAGAVGTVDVTVSGPGGTSATTAADSFTYLVPGAPVVNAVDPSSGSSLGGTSVTLFGSGFLGATAATVGGTPAFNFFAESDTQMVLTTPGGTAGSTVDITVTTPVGSSPTSNADHFTFTVPTAPVINGVSPNRGGTNGGLRVQIFGSGLNGVTGAQFGSVASSNFFSESDDSMQATSPAGALGTVDITVRGPGGASALSSADNFTYFAAPAPTVTAVSPNSGPAGTLVYVTGTGFSDLTGILFGSTCVFFFGSTFGDTIAQVVAPAGVSGTVDVRAVTPEGTSAITPADQFTFSAPTTPTVTAVAPASGQSAGGTVVFVTGTGLLGVTSVTFGATPVNQNRGGFFPFDDNLLEVVSPAGTSGATIDIRVTSPGGTSAINSGDQFTWVPTPAPAISAVSPNSGPSAGGTVVFVTGSGFSGVNQMQFGSAALAACLFRGGPGGGFGIAAQQQQEQQQALRTVRVPIATQVPIHQSASRGARTPGAPQYATVFTPSAPLVVHGSGRLAPLTRTLSPAAQAAAPPAPCAFSILGDSLIAVASPPQGSNPATVDLTVTSPGGTSATSAADHFTYTPTPAPVVTAVSPSSGRSGGGDRVFISGSNLTNPTGVNFGSGPASVLGTNASCAQFFIFVTRSCPTSDSVILVASPPGTSGTTVDVTVTTAGGTSATSAADHFAYGATPQPTVAAVAPASGPVGTTVYITGTGFSGVTAVNFGSTPATPVSPSRQTRVPAAAAGFHFAVLSDTLIAAASPNHAAGVVDVTVVTAGGTSPTTANDQYTFTASPTPVVTAIGPSTGATGTTVYINGSGFTGATAVSFGGTSATSFSVLSDSLIVATSPAGTGTVDITVSTPGGTSATSAADQWTFGVGVLPAPTVTSVSPGVGAQAGGTSVTITGTNFTGATGVSFGAVAAAAFTVNSATSITATSPAGAGTVDVTVTTPGGTSATSAADKFTYAPACSAAANPASNAAISTRQYALANSDGASWQEIDPARLRLACAPTASQPVLLSANADLWTANAGFNQDIGIFVSDNGGADQLLGWKESGGSAGTFSPNAAYLQTVFNLVAGHVYVFKLKWKTNKPAPGATIFAAAGGAPVFSPTSLIAESFPSTVATNFAVANQQYVLANSDGASWQTIDPVKLSASLSPVANSTVVLGANADLWTANAGFNQDLGIFVSDNGTPDVLVAWKESGGSAGTFSPNAAFVKSTFAMTAGHTYVFKLKWKTNKPALGATVFAAAGNSPNFSPTSLFTEVLPAGPNPFTAVSTSQYALANSDGVTWQTIDSALNVSVTPGSATNSILGGNADLWTANAGFNQDLAIFVSDNGGADVLVAWKESGGFAGTFSPNAAFVQAFFPMQAGHTYVFKLKWKTNSNAAGATVFAAAGGPAPFSPTRLTVELTS